MNKIEEVFAKYFSEWGIILPHKNVIQSKGGVIRKEGWIIKYLFGSDKLGDYLDFYASHRMTNDRHERIYESGKVISLTTLWDMVVYPQDPTEEQKKKINRKFNEHNRKVRKILQHKGFY